MTKDDVISWARLVGIEVHERKQQARVGLDVLFGDDSTGKLQRMCYLAAAAERRKHQADIEAWKAEAATAEKWRALALAKDPMQPGKAVQEIQREAAAAEREACAQVLCGAADGLEPEGKRTNQVDRHVADVLRAKAAAIRARGQA